MDDTTDIYIHEDLPAYIVSGAPLIRAMCEAIGLREIIDRNVLWDREQCKLSPGERIQALVINLLTNHRPLYRVDESFECSDIALLFGEGIALSDLNDDCLGRGLDKLWEGNPGKIFSMIVANALVTEDVERQFTHFDTTSRTLFGDYREDEEESSASKTKEAASAKTAEKTEEAPSPSPKKRTPVRPTYGYSKDHRPDLKQILFTLFVNREGIPLFGEVRDGNLSDKKANREMISELCRLFSPEELKTMVYVADSALITGPNLAALREKGITFLSRLPETYGVCGEVKKKAFEDDRWLPIGRISEHTHSAALYRASEQTGTIDAHPYRLVVYHSSALDRRKEKTFEKELSDEARRIGRAAAALRGRVFSCREDAEKEAGSFLGAFSESFHHVTADVVSREREKPRKAPGRPKAGEVRETETVFTVSAHIGEPKREVIRAERERRSTFVLITTLPKEEVSAADLLREYKDQTSCEKRFSFIKDPAFVDAIFLKRRERIEALGYVILLACLVFSLLERRVRKCGRPLTSKVRGRLANPTGQEILKHLVGVTVVRTGARTRSVHVPPSKAKPFREILSMAGFGPEIYARVPTPACRSG